MIKGGHDRSVWNNNNELGKQTLQEVALQHTKSKCFKSNKHHFYPACDYIVDIIARVCLWSLKLRRLENI